MRILVVEDDFKIAAFIKKGLEDEHYAVDVFHNGEDGAHWAIENEYDVIILDIMLPVKNGFEICKEIRENHINTPVLMLTAKDAIEDRVTGLDLGADDYLCKPFSFEEFLARIRALLRREQGYKETLLKVADLEYDPHSRKVSRGGKNITLVGKEYPLLEYLMRNEGVVLTESQIMEHVWDMNYDSLANTLNVYLHHLRKKIDKDFSNKLIHTIRNVGYVLKDDSK